MIVRFDESLPKFVDLLALLFGADRVSGGVIVRDAGGRLSAILPVPIDPGELASAQVRIVAELGAYARPLDVVSDIDTQGARRLIDEGTRKAPLKMSGIEIRLLDRRIVGSDWLRPPAQSSPGIPRIVFASLKGGVGRSTALCVLAAHLSARGRRVLAIDFDLEAPGIGTMLLNRQELPKFGTLDYLVENGLSGIDEAFIADLNGDSILGSAGGRVTVIPAIGQATINNPADALSKISRAYLEDIGEDGYIASLSDQLLEMVSLFEKTGAYDIVLVDVRAGLHETTAAAILGLGAEVLLFGSDQPQTFLGYNLLLAHLARFPIQAEDDWRDRLRFVHAKASDSARKRASADERFLQLYDLIVQTPPDSGSTEPLNADDFDLVWEDELVDLSLIDPFEAPSIIHILDDMRYRDFDPVSDDTLLDSASYGGTFKELLEYADMMIDYSEPSQL